jgi:MoxR-like ATPase
MTTKRYSGTATEFYVARPDVADIVNLAIDLKRPILVEGEPGCGKTQLAYSIAAELQLGEVVRISVKSTSRAQDLLVRMNALRRLQDAQRTGVRDAQFIYPYLSLGPLGQAIASGERAVVLIDEIDKADIDFPNDLLDVLDRDFAFQVDELPPEEEEKCRERNGFGRTVRGNAESPPIVVITSNREKRLPEPFLRRCLYARVTFPQDASELHDIVRKNTRGQIDDLADETLNAMVVAFLRVRNLARGNTHKPPTTSELIDWVRILHWKGVAPEALAGETVIPPFWQTLFKTMHDLDAYQALAAARTRPA